MAGKYSPAAQQKLASYELFMNDVARIRAMGVEPVFAELVGRNHVARHQSRRLAQLLLDLAAQRRRPAR